MVSEIDVSGRRNDLALKKTAANLDAEAMAPLSLIGDIGATNARFALADATGNIHGTRISACRDHAGLADAIEAYLEAVCSNAAGTSMRPMAAAIAVAGPVHGDQPHPGCGRRGRVGAQQPGAGAGVQEQRRVAPPVTPLGPGQQPPIRQPQRLVDERNRHVRVCWHPRSVSRPAGRCRPGSR